MEVRHGYDGGATAEEIAVANMSMPQLLSDVEVLQQLDAAITIQLTQLQPGEA